MTVLAFDLLRSPPRHVTSSAIGVRTAGEDVETKGRGQAQLVGSPPRPAGAREQLPAHASHSAGGMATKTLKYIKKTSASTATKTVGRGGGESRGKTVFCVTPDRGIQYYCREDTISGGRVTRAAVVDSTIRKVPRRTAPARQTQSQVSNNLETVWKKKHS